MNANLLLQSISSLESYPNSKDFRIRILRGDKKGKNSLSIPVMELVSQTVCSVLETSSATPLSRLLAVRVTINVNSS